MIHELYQKEKRRKQKEHSSALNDLSATDKSSRSSPLEPSTIVCSSVSILPPVPMGHHVILPMDSGFLRYPTGPWVSTRVNLTF